MPPRLEEMLREQNRLVREGMEGKGDINTFLHCSRVQLERVQYSTHYFAFIASATAKALAVRLFPWILCVSLLIYQTADLNPDYAEALSLATMKSFSSFLVHNGLFASRDLMSDDSVSKVRQYIHFLLELVLLTLDAQVFIQDMVIIHVSSCLVLVCSCVVHNSRSLLTWYLRLLPIRIRSPCKKLLFISLFQFTYFLNWNINNNCTGARVLSNLDHGDDGVSEWEQGSIGSVSETRGWVGREGGGMDTSFMNSLLFSCLTRCSSTRSFYSSLPSSLSSSCQSTRNASLQAQCSISYRVDKLLSSDNRSGR